MEFWGVEVKPGESLPVCPEEGQLVHISQVALGEVKNVKAANYVPVHLTVDGKKFVIGTLSAERAPQISFDLVVEKEFELSHDWKDGSIYFCGYTADDQEDGPVDHEGFSDEDGEEQETLDSEEEEQLNAKPVSAPQAPKPANAKAAAKTSDSKAAAKPKPKVTLIDPKDEKDESDESDDSDDDESDGDDLENDSDDDMSEDEETPQKTPPKKAEASKKRPSESEVKTPASKKSKNETPLKTDGKKGNVHTATPHPAKKSEKKTAESPKSSAQVCKTCSKSFTSEKGLESHSKAKHGGK